MSSDFQNALSVVIPVYNEVDNVKTLAQEIMSVLGAASYHYEIIFVDDGSTDGTRERLRELANEYDPVRYIAHVGNYGQSVALLSGVKAAAYPMVVTMDGDGQNDPADIIKLVAALKETRTVVLGNRKKRDDNQVRRLSSRIGNGVRRRLLDDGCPDTGCSLKLFPRDAFLALPHFNHMHRYLPALFIRSGFKLVNVEVNHRARCFGVSKYGVMNRLFVGIHDLIGMRWLLKRPCNPEVHNYES